MKGEGIMIKEFGVTNLEVTKEDISKNKLMIELEKSPLHLIKEEIRTLLK